MENIQKNFSYKLNEILISNRLDSLFHNVFTSIKYYKLRDQIIIFTITDKNFNPIKNEFLLSNKVIIPANNPISGITKQTVQDTIMIKTKYGFVSANSFYFDEGSSLFIAAPFEDYYVTASSGNLKNSFKVRIEFDNDGTGWSNGVKFARRIRVYTCK
jgi:hypothetical protein